MMKYDISGDSSNVMRVSSFDSFQTGFWFGLHFKLNANLNDHEELKHENVSWRLCPVKDATVRFLKCSCGCSAPSHLKHTWHQTTTSQVKTLTDTQWTIKNPNSSQWHLNAAAVSKRIWANQRQRVFRCSQNHTNSNQVKLILVWKKRFRGDVPRSWDGFAVLFMEHMAQGANLLSRTATWDLQACPCLNIKRRKSSSESRPGEQQQNLSWCYCSHNKGPAHVSLTLLFGCELCECLRCWARIFL